MFGNRTKTNLLLDELMLFPITGDGIARCVISVKRKMVKIMTNVPINQFVHTGLCCLVLFKNSMSKLVEAVKSKIITAAEMAIDKKCVTEILDSKAALRKELAMK